MTEHLTLSEEDEYARERSLGWLLHDAQRLLSRSVERHFSEYNLTGPQTRVLANLYRCDGLTQTQLADLVSMEKAPLGRLLDRLEESGWIERRADPADRRAKRVYLVPDRFETILPVFQEVAKRVFDRALAGLSQREIDRLMSSLQVLKDNLACAEGDAAQKEVDAAEGRPRR